MFALTQMLLMILWGRAADRVGRKPVLVFSLFGVSFASAVFGLSTRIWQLILCRCCAGMFAGSVVYVPALSLFCGLDKYLENMRVWNVTGVMKSTFAGTW